MNEELKAKIIDIISTNKPDGIVTRLKHLPQLWNEIITNTPELKYKNYAHRVYHYLNELTELKRCPCGSTVTFQNLTSGYRDFCSRECSFAKAAATERRVKRMKENGGVGLANPLTRNKQSDTLYLAYQINDPNQNPHTPLTKDEIKAKIQELFEKAPKHYSKIIQNDPVLWQWVLANNQLTGNSDSIAAMIYSAFYEKSDVCPEGNILKFNRWSSGFAFCGHASVCKCNRELSAEKTSEAKLAYSDEKKEYIGEKRKKSMMEKFGVEFNLLRPDVIEKLKRPKVDSEIYDKLMDYDWINEEYNNKRRTATDIANDLLIHYSTVINYCRKHGFRIRKTTNYSMEERQISAFLSELGQTHEINDWSVLENLEFDILIKEKNMAIEMNGVRWHAYDPNFKNPNGLKLEDPYRHLQKTQMAAELGIFLFHVTDLEWNNQRDIIKSQLNSKLGLSDRIYARQCDIRMVDSKQARAFLNENHIQGAMNSTHYIGLYHKDELVMLMSAGKHRFVKNFDGIEIHRMCSKLNTTVVGGGSKLIKRLKEITHDCPIESYCDIQKSDGKGYLQMGFTLDRITDPGYYWTDMKSIIPRSKTQKKILPKWLPNFDPNLSEPQNMWNNRYARYHDCGNFVFKI